MRKKSLFVVTAIMLCIVLIFSAAACDGKVNEVQEYKQILTSIVKSYLDNMPEQTESGANLSLLSAELRIESPNELFDVLNGVGEKNSSDFKRWGLPIWYLMDMLSYCESLEEVYGVKKLYGHTIFLSEFPYSELGVTQEGYFTVVSKGNRKIAYLYGSKEGGAAESFHIFDIEYINDNNFSVTILLIEEADGGFENSYLYFDSNDKFACIDKNSAYFSESSNLDDCFKVVDESALENCFSLLQPKFDAVDLDAVRAYDNKDYHITEEQFNAAREVVAKLFEE
ncbi:MAG: hypothetical protein K2G37_00600 [Clostridia bacterium]|nr:hypothetical protein [Clostridia bacterium]MDE7328471.1 hypothetical protein [Clostridia bacterium]